MALILICWNIVGLDGFDVRKIDDIEYTVEISCYFLTKWRDDRLLLHEDILKVGESAAINGTTTAAEETWFPIDLEFVSKVRADFLLWRKEPDNDPSAFLDLVARRGGAQLENI